MLHIEDEKYDYRVSFIQKEFCDFNASLKGKNSPLVKQVTCQARPNQRRDKVKPALVHQGYLGDQEQKMRHPCLRVA